MSADPNEIIMHEDALTMSQVTGLAVVASQAEAIAHTENTKTMTSLRTAQAITAFSPTWYYHQISLADLQGAGNSATGTFTVLTLQAKGAIHAVKVVQETALAGGTTSAAAIVVGVAGTTNQLFTTQDVFTAASGPYLSTTGKIYSESVTKTIIATTTLTGDTHNHLTAGVIGVYLLVSDTAHVN